MIDYPTTTALLAFWDLVGPDIELDEAPGTKVLPAGAHAAELVHWTWSYRVWNGWRNPRATTRACTVCGDPVTCSFSWCSCCEEPPEYGEGWHGFP